MDQINIPYKKSKQNNDRNDDDNDYAVPLRLSFLFVHLNVRLLQIFPIIDIVTIHNTIMGP